MKNIFKPTLFHLAVVPELVTILLFCGCGMFQNLRTREQKHIFEAEPNRQLDHGMGEMVGEVTDSSSILQSRLTYGNTLVGIEERFDRLFGDLPGLEGVACFEISTDSTFKKLHSTEWLKARPEDDFIVKTKVTGLEPATRYYYRLLYGQDTLSVKKGNTCTFMTLPGKSESSITTLIIVTGMNYDCFHSRRWRLRDPDAAHYLGYETFETLLKMAPDYFIGTGDNVYFDGRCTEPQKISRSKKELRRRYHEQFSQLWLIKFFSRVGTYWEKDDHDYRKNNSDPWGDYAPSHELGCRIFLEQLPVADPKEKDPKTYRTFRINKMLQIWLVEGRDYRSCNAMEDGPEKTIWGREQKEWLKNSLVASDATFRILISPTPMVGPVGHKDKGPRDSHPNWFGFRHERDEFFSWLIKNRFLEKNFYLICGDCHWQYHAVDLPTGIEEFCTGCVDRTNCHHGIGQLPKQEDRVEHPYHQKTVTGGFLMVKTLPAQGEIPDRLEFTFYSQSGKELYKERKIAK
jgi:alkaline phosphatase D